MSYKSVSDCESYRSVNSEDTRNELYAKHIDFVLNLPQVASGSVDAITAENWLREVVRIVDAPYIGSLIKKSSGFTTEEISALYRYENNDYRPVLHASEVYSAKNLLSIDLTGLEATDKGLIRDDSMIAARGIAISATKNHIGDLENRELRDKLINGYNPQAPWAIVNPPIIVSNGENHIIIGINAKLPNQVTERTSFESTLGDKIRLNYQAAVMQMAGIQTKPILQQVVFIKSRSLMEEQVSTLKTIGAFNKVGITQIATSDNLPIKNSQIDFDPELAKSLIQIGHKHWENIAVKGIEPDFKKNTAAQIPLEVVNLRNQAAEKVFTIGMAKQTLEAIDVDARAELRQIDSTYGISASQQGISKLVSKVEHSKVDYTALINELTARDIPLSSFMKRDFDAESMAKSARYAPINPADFIVYNDVDKNKILTTAEMVGIDIAKFSNEDNKLNISGDTRGPIHKCKVEIKESAEIALNQLITGLSNNPILKSPAVFGADSRRKEQPSTQANNESQTRINTPSQTTIGM